MFRTKFCLFLAIFSIFSSSVNTNQPNPPGNGLVHKRFEYKYSFKPPYLAQKDGTVPFWEYGGNAIASSENVRVAPSLRSQKGAIWTKSKTNFDWWEVEIVFRVTGRGRIGADGLAFWYTQEKGDYNGNVFGSSDKWNGLGIFFDSFDNDNKHNNPYIMAVLNDGTKLFDHANDGTTQLLSGCLRDFRNKPFPTRAKIEYYNNILTVLFHNGMTNNNEDYEMCLRSDGVILPKNGYFGISAATGGLADDHDVFHFLTHSLHLPGTMEDHVKKIEDSDKLKKEYEEYQEKLNQQKKDYRKDHPEEKKPEDEWGDEWFETDNQRELRQIFQGQSQMSEGIKEISRKMDEVIGRQENTLSLISRGIPVQQQQQQPQVQGGQQQPVVQQVPVGGLTRQDLDLLINNQNMISHSIRELQGTLQTVNAKADGIIQKQATGTGSVQPAGNAGYDIQGLIAEMRDGLNQVKNGIAHVGQRVNTPQAQTGCPNCVGVTLYLGITAVQLILMLLYSWYKSRSEAQAKKFY